MKKLIAVILSITILLPCTIISADKGLLVAPENNITYKQAHQFADELKELKGNADYRLIVSSDEKIEYKNAVEAASGIDGLYVLQYDSLDSVKEAENYYNSLPCVNYVQYDSEQNALCENDDFDFVAQDYSTVICNIDDSIKLLHKENYDFEDIKIGIVDTGVTSTGFTQDRLVGGYSFINNLSEDGRQDIKGHGTKVAGSIILNTLDNVKITPYQAFDANGQGNVSQAVAAIYLAASENCKIINCSFCFEVNNSSESDAFTQAIDYATDMGSIVVVSAGNNFKNLNVNPRYPACVESAITVGATTVKNTLAKFSNLGDCVDIFAPGENLVSYDKNGNIVTDWGGTSASAPITVAMLTSLLTVNPDYTIDEMIELLNETGNTFVTPDTDNEKYVIADLYSTLVHVTGKALERVQLDYSVSFDDNEQVYTFSFDTDDDATVYYYYPMETLSYQPFSRDTEYEKGTTVYDQKKLGFNTYCACAYAPNKAKSIVQMFSTQQYVKPTKYNIFGYYLQYVNNRGEIRRCMAEQNTVVVQGSFYQNQITPYSKISANCFTGNKNIETVILPEYITEIGDYAFANCPNLKTVIAPGLTTCGAFAFYRCPNLERVIMPNVTSANTGLFKDCSSLEILNIGELTKICNDAFSGCDSLEHIGIPENSSQGECAHYNLTSTDYRLPDCRNGGYVVIECPDCDYSYTEAFDAVGHRFVDTVYEPNCTFKGYTFHSCFVCQYTYEDNYKPIDKNSHNFYTEIEKRPTIMVPGKVYYCCWDCGYYEPAYTPALYDFNGDLFVNGKDIAMMKHAARGLLSPDGKNYDINNDGVVDDSDYEKMIVDYKSHYSEFVEFYNSELRNNVH